MTKMVLAVIAALLMAGCNTMEGLGKDIQKAGDKIEETARKAK
jgi:entericidin A